MTVSFFVSAVPKNAEALPNSETSTYMWYSIGGAKGGFNVMGVTNGSPAVKVTYGSGNGNGFEVVAKVDTSQTSSGSGLKYSTNGQTEQICSTIEQICSIGHNSKSIRLFIT